MDAILKFPDIDGSMLAPAGGKAVNLGVLTRAGLPVPPGFCVTTEAYRAITAGLGDVTDPAVARKHILDATIPAALARAVVEALPGGPVAVRSSATAEDLPYASFAGQQDTFLNVVGPEAVLDAVRRCWASLWTDRAVAYRESNGIDHRTVSLAVVVQRMVESRTAGVMFTANPVTGRRRQAVIDAAPGLGESVVSGAVNPDHFVVDPDSGPVLERRPGDKLLAVRPVPGGGVVHERAAASGEPCLTDGELRELAALGARVEELYGAPQDLEWAFDQAGKLWLTQARPITTLFPVPGGHRGEGLRAYFCFSVAQGVFRPFTPMGLAAARAVSAGVSGLFGFPVAAPLAGAPAFAAAGGRLFIDVTGVLRSRVGRAVVPRVFDVMEARSARVLRGLFDDPRLSVTRRSVWPFARRVAAITLRHGVPVTFVRALADPAGAERRVRRQADAHLARLAPPTGASLTERVDHVARALIGQVVPIAPRAFPVAAAAVPMLLLAARLLKGRVAPGELQTVLRGAPRNVTTEMDLALWALAQRLRRDPAVAARFLSEPPARLAREPLPAPVRDFLDEYGHRAVAEIDLGLPRWSEDPTHVIGMLANYLRLEDPALAPDVLFARGVAEAEAMIEELAGRVGGLRGRVVRFALGRARELVGVRELPKFLIVRIFAALRAQLLDVGRELVGRGLLDASGDVFFLTLAEAKSGQDLRGRVAERREVHERELRRRHVPRVLLSDGTEPEAVASGGAAEGALTGSPASPGAVTGVARVVLDPVGAHLEPGEILVCPSTDPGWTPLFLTAGGLVMEMGGSNSHGAVVAREYGIPAVVGVPHAVERIRTGQTVTVDGTAGTVA
ncbi:phosphoenolpyruvate synthase [Nonomuraea sp. WAC 01424]|uniref:PEP/pyruvate-binding domain-containing protein n=1 Tax=Nonomuraea sp. WAC 01424 TaxID=2203200 RepID=UPI000F76B588|nr:PEP/pyruvate-binding domain-containing protein [Nonomuraea sp. WAC 01424]RSN13997.1 phosphoenolpyruvate synthase [Nonomuraea sp. WAC 01424]